MYKDKDRQREANRERQRRYKARHKGVTSEGVTNKALPDGTMDIKTLAMMDAGCGDKLSHGLEQMILKPGDAGYLPQCETTRAFIKDRPKVKSESKRGLDIKCFEDLPPDVQQTIRRVSDSNEEFKRRMAIAVSYQHTFGAGAYYPHGATCTGVVTGKPGDED